MVNWQLGISHPCRAETSFLQCFSGVWWWVHVFFLFSCIFAGAIVNKSVQKKNGETDLCVWKQYYKLLQVYKSKDTTSWTKYAKSNAIKQGPILFLMVIRQRRGQRQELKTYLLTVPGCQSTQLECQLNTCSEQKNSEQKREPKREVEILGENDQP